jgi:hypothetical protein
MEQFCLLFLLLPADMAREDAVQLLLLLSLSPSRKIWADESGTERQGLSGFLSLD